MGSEKLAVFYALLNIVRLLLTILVISRLHDKKRMDESYIKHCVTLKTVH